MIKGTSSIGITHDSLLTEVEYETSEGATQRTVRRAKAGDSISQFKATVLCLSVVRYDNVVAGLVLGVSTQDPCEWERLGTFAAGTEATLKSLEKELVLV